MVLLHPFATDPPTVQASHSCGDVNEGEDCTLTSLATGGNPNSGFTYQWTFQRKFESSAPQVLAGETSSALLLESVTHMSAGQYHCDVSNEGGTANDDVTLNVNCKNIILCSACYP